MAAATTARITAEKILGKFSAPVAASTTIYAGTLVALDSNGRVVPVSAASTLRAVGRACTRGGLSVWDNASGSAGAFDVEIEEGIFFWDNSSAGDAIAQADVGKVVYGVDDQTVAKTSNTGARSVAGVARYVDSTLGVAVESSLALSRALLAEANASGIAITQTYSTAVTTQSNLTSATLTDSTTGTATTTVEDVGAAFSQATLNNNFADVVAQINALRVDIVNVKGVLNSVIDAMQANGSIG
jgi:phage portal protein BeeE